MSSYLVTNKRKAPCSLRITTQAMWMGYCSPAIGSQTCVCSVRVAASLWWCWTTGLSSAWRLPFLPHSDVVAAAFAALHFSLPKAAVSWIIGKMHGLEGDSSDCKAPH